MINNCCFIGENAGRHIEEGHGIVIIGDNIFDLDPDKNDGVLFIGEKVAIGETLFGEKINLKSVLEKYLEKIKMNP